MLRLFALGLVVGVFLFGPYGALGFAIVVGVAQHSPLAGVTPLGALLVLEKWQ